MLKTAKDYRTEAKNNCEAYTGTLILITLVVMIIELIIGFTIKEKVVIDGMQVTQSRQPLSFLAIFLSGQIAIGWALVSKKVYSRSNLKFGDIFLGFNSNYFKWSWAYLLQAIYLSLWAIISFGVMAIIKSLAYSMTYYILEDHPTWSVNEAITESRRIMNGHKWRYFCLILSYLGWMILCVLSFGILSLWVTPRMNQATYLFYKDISA